jgi:hypothetical protein
MISVEQVMMVNGIIDNKKDKCLLLYC